MKKIKVCYFIKDLEDGGAQKVVATLSSSSQIDATIIIFNIKNLNKFLIPNFKNSNIKIYSLTKFSDIKNILLALINAQLLHVNLFPELYFCTFVPKKKVFTEHNTWNRRRKFKIFQLLDSFAYKNYEKVICISKPVKKELVNWIGLESRVTVINNGINLISFKKSKRLKLSLSEKKKINIGMSGRFVLQKDHETLIKSLNEIHENVNLFLFGDGPLLSELKFLVKNLDLTKRVIFRGWVNDINKELDEIDLYVQASNWEGFGLSVVEAMAKGIPVLGSKVPGLKEVIGSNKYLFKKNSKDQLVEKIKFILDNDQNYYLASDFALKRSKKYSDKLMIENYLDLYKNLG